MMQAVLIIAHTDFGQCMKLTEKIRKHFLPIIHFDLKMQLTEAQRNELEQKQIEWIQEVDVHWGGWSIGEVMKRLLVRAMAHPDVTRIHFISGQDWPAALPEEICRFYENSRKQYFLYRNAEEEYKSKEHLIDWAKYYYPYDKMNRRSLFGKVFHRISMRVQKILHINKLKKYKITVPVYYGATWMSLTREAVEYVLTFYEQHPNYRRLFETSFCPDEAWIQTVLVNSPFGKETERNIHRYICWETRHNSYPAVLDMQDFPKLQSGEFHFMRKVDGTISKELIEALESRG